MKNALLLIALLISVAAQAQNAAKRRLAQKVDSVHEAQRAEALTEEKAAEKRAAANHKKAIAQREQEKNNRWLKLKVKYGKYPDEWINTIMDHKVVIGMTEEMCIDAWGKPAHIDRTLTAQHRREQWAYGTDFLYLDDGRLTTIQNIK